VVHMIWSDMRDGHRAIYYKRNPTGNAGATGIYSSRRNPAALVSSPSTRSVRSMLFVNFHGRVPCNGSLYDLCGRMMTVPATGSAASAIPQGIYVLKAKGVSGE
jgi:hypothetical protein